jgi:hypothetical protein
MARNVGDPRVCTPPRGLSSRYAAACEKRLSAVIELAPLISKILWRGVCDNHVRQKSLNRSGASSA